MKSEQMKGKNAIVTGAGRGIGKAIALRLASEGVNILINHPGTQAEAEETQKLCELCGVKVVVFKADVTDIAECEAMFRFAIKELGSVDILVNNAGITRDNLLMRMSEAEFDQVIDVNLKGSFNCMKLASRPMMKARFGRIVNIASVVGIVGNAGQVNYSASKAGIIGMTKSAAKELAKRGITINAVAPGFIETDMTAVLPDDIRSDMLKSIPMEALGRPEDIAGVVAFLCSEDANYITGQVINIDGGMVM